MVPLKKTPKKKKTILRRVVREEWPDGFKLTGRLVPQLTTLYNRVEQQGILKQIIRQQFGDGLQQKKGSSGSSGVGQEQEYVAAHGTGFP